jgi:ribosome-associated toxin RatA of RatAB toxin-antitoxin module
MNKLQKTLLTNAVFSSVSGASLIFASQYFAQLFAISYYSIFWIVGLVLLLFSLTILYEIKRQNPIGVLFIIIQDFLWVIGSVILLIFKPFDISTTGNGIIAVIALIVLLMGINQSNALAQIDHKKQGTKQLSFNRTVKANQEKTWKVISDVANYHKVAPNIDDVKIISGEGKGMVRSCSHGKNSWKETCTAWVDKKAYSFEVDTFVPDYPFPFKSLKGTWEIEDLGNHSTIIKMNFEFQYKRKFQNWLLHPLLKNKFSKVAEELLDNWQSIIEKS